MKKTSDRRARRSRKMLQEALLELIDKRPYAKISVSDITEQADLARVTFYAHFETKDDLLLSYFHEISEDLFGCYDNPREWSNEEADYEKEKMVQFFEKWQKKENILRMIETPEIEMLLSKTFKDKHRQIYKTNIAVTRSDLSPAFASYWTNFLSNTKIGLLRQWVENDLQQSPQLMGELLHQLCGIHVAIQTVERFKERM